MNLLFITAHYDDLEICAGGTAAKHGGTAVVLFPKPDKGTGEEAAKAYEHLNVKPFNVSHHTRTAVDQLTLEAEGYDLIVTNHKWDSHPDHQAAASIAEQVARKNTCGLWYMDHAIPGGWPDGPRPNTFVTASPGIHSAKLDALDAYDAISFTDLTAIVARDAYYGRIHGTDYAEGFIQRHALK